MSPYGMVEPQNHRKPSNMKRKTSFDEQMFLKWNNQENLDSCYQIVNVSNFLMAITKAIENSAFHHLHSHITYTEEIVNHDSKDANVTPAFTKYKNKYSWQHENRSLWVKREPSGLLKPWIIYVPEAIQYCKPFAYLDDEIISYSLPSR